ncbi:hypothetical protein [Mycolicibacterium conceptionense]|uniref:hypothetical protein n=1 Tax=Mycolicibacterium conceptionense TaxID=451644 RepID=UPI00096D9A29|nr:hypothetical protein [Mycolicibacterium conceptionense]OMB79430.1 hypothetical protein A5743_13650 [Mycolicibacterium conceptionense]
MKTDPTSAGETPGTTNERAALLRRAYEGELIGCAMYQQMVDGRSHSNTEVLQLLYEIERITADALQPLIVRHALTVSEAEAEREGRRIADSLAGKPWKSMWAEVIQLADEYLTDFKRLTAVLEGEEAAVGRQVVEHEEALIEFAHGEIKGSADALAPLWAYHRRYAAQQPLP